MPTMIKNLKLFFCLIVILNVLEIIIERTIKSYIMRFVNCAVAYLLNSGRWF